MWACAQLVPVLVSHPLLPKQPTWACLPRCFGECEPPSTPLVHKLGLGIVGRRDGAATSETATPKAAKLCTLCLAERVPQGACKPTHPCKPLLAVWRVNRDRICDQTGQMPVVTKYTESQPPGNMCCRHFRQCRISAQQTDAD